jgi:hypothetical protein
MRNNSACVAGHCGWTAATKIQNIFTNIQATTELKKHIWKIDNTFGHTVNDQNSIKEVAVNFFKDCYRAPTEQSITEQCKILDYYPRTITEEETNSLFQ